MTAGGRQDKSNRQSKEMDSEVVMEMRALQPKQSLRSYPITTAKPHPDPPPPTSTLLEVQRLTGPEPFEFLPYHPPRLLLLHPHFTQSHSVHRQWCYNVCLTQDRKKCLFDEAHFHVNCQTATNHLIIMYISGLSFSIKKTTLV